MYELVVLLVMDCLIVFVFYTYHRQILLASNAALRVTQHGCFLLHPGGHRTTHHRSWCTFFCWTLHRCPTIHWTPFRLMALSGTEWMITNHQYISKSFFVRFLNSVSSEHKRISQNFWHISRLVPRIWVSISVSNNWLLPQQLFIVWVGVKEFLCSCVWWMMFWLVCPHPDSTAVTCVWCVETPTVVSVFSRWRRRG